MTANIEKALNYTYEQFAKNLELKYPEKRGYLSFSLGKDSVANYFKLKELGFEVELLLFETFPGLEIIEEGIKEAEDQLGKKIHRLVHKSIWGWLNSGLFQDFETFSAIKESDANSYNYSFSEAIEVFHETYGREHLGMTDNYFEAVGTLAMDSIVRWGFFKRIGPIEKKNRKVYPLYSLSKKEVWDLLSKNNYILPRDYELFGVSFDSVQAKFMAPLKEHYPKDFELIKTFMPLVEVDILKQQKYGVIPIVQRQRNSPYKLIKK